jgi:hypothetical protein
MAWRTRIFAKNGKNDLNYAIFMLCKMLQGKKMNFMGGEGVFHHEIQDLVEGACARMAQIFPTANQCQMRA